jgi:RNA polymerase sigma factor (sigma-70 family)
VIVTRGPAGSGDQGGGIVVEDLLRDLAPQVLASLVRRDGDFDACEDAVQEALIAAAAEWPEAGIPRNPRGWLVTVARRRRIEAWRNEAARRRREDAVAAAGPQQQPVFGAPDADDAAASTDDTLRLLFLCCHPALTAASQVALTLRAVGGLTTGEIARAFLVPEATMAQRISRAKERIRAAGVSFRMPDEAERPARLAAILRVLYLAFNEGYTASSGDALVRVDLTREAMRLARQLHAALPGEGEVAGLLALMLLTDARRPARTRPDGSLVPLAEQDRRLWDASAVEEGVALVTTSLATAPVGPYQVQAAIAAVHDEAPRAADTDWPQILKLYELLERLAPGPMVTLNRIVAVAMVEGPTIALADLARAGAASGAALTGHHRFHAVRAHLLEMAGEPDAATQAYRVAARRTLSLPERRYLESRAAGLDRRSPPGRP